MILDPEWQEFLRGLAREQPDSATAVVGVPPGELQETDLEDLGDRALPLLALRIDHENKEITLHTDADEDREPLSPIPLTIREVVDILSDASFPLFPVYWVSGWERLAIPPEDLEPKDRDGAFYARLARPAVGIAVSQVNHQVLFMAEEPAGAPE